MLSVPSVLFTPRACASASRMRKFVSNIAYCPGAGTDPVIVNVRPRASCTVTDTCAFCTRSRSRYACAIASSS
jgi:hypothetical protein